jgi:acetyl esterase/lipase
MWVRASSAQVVASVVASRGRCEPVSGSGRGEIVTTQQRTPIDPALRAYLDEVAANTPPLPPHLTALERAALGRVGMERALASRAEIAGLPNDVQVRDIALTLTLQARLFTPAAAASEASAASETDAARGLPIVVYLHGGG